MNTTFWRSNDLTNCISYPYMVIFSIVPRTPERQPANESFNLLKVDFVLFSPLSPCVALSQGLCLNVICELIPHNH